MVITRAIRKQKLAEGLKWCIDHEDFLAVSLFSPRSSRCHECRNNRVALLDQQTSNEKKLESARKPRNKEQRRLYYQENKDVIKDKNRQKKYNVSSEWYDEKLKEQGGHCALCPMTPEEQGRDLSMDHDHETGKPRRLLCGRCNTSLERVEAIPGWADKSEGYLHRYSGRVF